MGRITCILEILELLIVAEALFVYNSVLLSNQTENLHVTHLC